MKKERKNRTSDELIADLQARIQTVRAREERKKLNADPGRRHAKLALASLRRAIEATEDGVFLTALKEVVPGLERALGTQPSSPTTTRRNHARSAQQ